MSDEELYRRVHEVLETVRPNIQMDGGDIEFVSCDRDVVYVRFLGACIGCPLATITLKLYVEEAIKEQLPDIREVIAVES